MTRLFSLFVVSLLTSCAGLAADIDSGIWCDPALGVVAGPDDARPVHYCPSGTQCREGHSAAYSCCSGSYCP